VTEIVLTIKPRFISVKVEHKKCIRLKALPGMLSAEVARNQKGLASGRKVRECTRLSLDSHIERVRKEFPDSGGRK
jgi:hypothetical protein